RDGAWWAYRLHDPEHGRDGASALRCAVTDGGYALYSQTARWSDGVPSGTVTVRELVAVDEPARERLWRFLLDLDLMGEVVCRSVAVDDPLLQLLAEPRAARSRLSDDLWVRLVDVGAALSSRRYAADVDVVLEVQDTLCPWNAGRWRLTGGRAGAACVPDDSPADLVLDVTDLGAAYLGGTALSSRRATVQERTPGALARASTAFGPLDAAPWCPMVF
ncbi:MAG: family N-acetyltransferase, partial [Frankiales bacterium]|nr:family N-acetyltransferase [Frankiales bacterium]